MPDQFAETDQFTERARSSWGNRLSSAIAGVVFGFILFCGSFFLLSWNEGRSLDRFMALEEVRASVASVAADKPDAAHDGKPVYLTGQAVADSEIADPMFGMRARVLKLRRTVLVYQWKEVESTSSHKDLGGGQTTTKTYTYSKVWESGARDSSHFRHPAGHENAPVSFRTETFVAGAHVGAFALSGPFTGMLGNFEEVAIPDAAYQNLSPALRNKLKLTGAEYVSGDPAHPAIGDVRISFEVVPETEVSLIGKQDGAKIEPYTAKNGDNVNLLGTGVVSPAVLLNAAKQQNTILTWVARFGGFVMMWAGLGMVLGPISAVASIVPFLGGLLDSGIALLTFFVAAPLSLVTIAVAWIAVRPVLGFGLLGLAAAVLFGGIMRRKQKPEVK